MIQSYQLESESAYIFIAPMKLKLYIFDSQVEIDCEQELNPEELQPYCKVDSFYKEEGKLHVKISNLKTNLTTIKKEIEKTQE